MKPTADDRLTLIINLFLKNTAYLNADEIGSVLDISRRNVYYAIDEINQLLEKAGLERIHKDYGKGMYLDTAQKNYLSNYFSGANLLDAYSLSASERIACIYCELVCSRRSYKINDFEKVFQISRNTIISDLNALKEKTAEFRLDIHFDIHTGYIVQGAELNLRKAFYYFYSVIYTDLLEHRNLFADFDFAGPGPKEIYARFREITEEGISYYDCSLMAISCILFRVLQNPKCTIQLVYSSGEQDLINKSEERKFLKEHFPHLSEDEIGYFSLYLIGSRMGDRKIYTENQDFSSVVAQMNEIFYLLSSIKIEDEDFVHQLAVHLELAAIRYKYGIAVDNPLITQIKTKYSSIYGIMRDVVKPIEEKLGSPISESEIGFITLYYAGKVANKNRNVPKVSTLVICLNGLSTSYLLKNEIENLDSRIEVTECVGLREYNSREYHVDLVVSTVPFTPKPGDRTIIIHPILTFEDKMAIGNIISKIIFGSESAPSYSKVLDIVKPYISSEKLDAAKQTLRHFYEKTDIHTQSIANNEIFREDFVAIDSSDDSWEKLIRKAAVPLISAGYIHEDYIQEMIDTIYEYGSYSVFQHGYLLGHASAEKSRHLGLSFLRLSRPVDIMGNMVSKILIITPNDYTSHLPYIFRLLNLFGSDEADRKVMEAKTSAEIFNIVIRYLIS